MDDSGNLARGGLRIAVTRFAGSALALLRTRLELASVELAEERERVQLRLGLLFGGVLLMLLGVMAFGAFVIVYYWENYRFAAIIGVALACFAAGLLLLKLAQNVSRGAPTPFAATLAELEKDRAWLTGSGLADLDRRNRPNA